MSQSALADELQVWGFDRDIIIFTDGSTGFGINIKPVDVSCMKDDDCDLLDSSIRNFLNGLPDKIDVQFIQHISKCNENEIDDTKKFFSSKKSLLQEKLCDERLLKFHKLNDDGLLPKQNLKVFVRVPFAKGLMDKTSLFKKATLFPEISGNRLLAEIIKTERLRDSIIKSLTDLGAMPSMMTEHEMFQEIFAFWNPDRKFNQDKDNPNDYDPEDVRSSLVYRGVTVGLDTFSVGSYHYKVISLKQLPSHTFATMSQLLAELPFNSHLAFSIHCPNQQSEVSSLQMQRRIAFSMLVGKSQGVSDLDSEAKLHDLEDLLSEMITSGEKVFHLSMQIFLKSKSKWVLEDMEAQTLLLLQKMSGADGLSETVAAFDIFSQAAVPNCRSNERKKKIKTSNLSNLLPIYGLWKGHKEPRVLLRSRKGNLMYFDPFSMDLTNANQIISGGSGSGKSFLMNLILMQVLKEKPKVFIVDIGGSYKKMCSQLDGQYIPLGLGENICINPFDLPAGERQPSNQKIKFLLALIEKMVKEDDRSGLGKYERTEIEAAILELYEKHEKPRLSDLQAYLLNHKQSDVKKLGVILSSWCGNSPYGKFLDRETNIALNNDFVCLDLKGLEPYPDLQSACLLIITDLISREVEKNKTEMKFVIFDECWQLLEDEKGEGAALVGNLFRTCRKYFASCIAISQNVDDFAKSAAANAVMSNSSTKWILRQKGADQERLKSTLQLNDNEMSLIASLHQRKGHYSEAFMMCEDRKAVVVVESTPIEYWLATTDPKDIAEIESLKEENPQMDQLEAMEYLSKKFPHGVLAERGGSL